ncbi:MAG: MFS transporter, partial [Acidimicrobiales bacterium]
MRARFRQAGTETFRALKVRNFRLFFTGQLLSASGSWMQRIALALIILSPTLHGNGFDVGVEMALEFLPMTLFGTLGGVVADRVDKRKLIIVSQSGAGLTALVLALLTGFGAITLWEVFLLAFLLGICTVFTNPARQAFVTEMVGRELLPNAVTLNGVLMNSARVIGPAIAGVLVYAVGFSACFYVNAASYVAVVAALSLMRASELNRTGHVARARGQVREGLRYAWSTPQIRRPLIAMAIVGMLTYNFSTTLPLLSEFTYHGGAGTYSIFTAAMGMGAVVGGLFIARRSRPSTGLLGVIGVGFGVAVAFVALLPIESLTVVALVVMGAFSIAFVATANATLQLSSDP